MKYFIKSSFILFPFFYFSCVQYDNKEACKEKEEIIAILDDQNILVNEVDSIICMQIYELRISALNSLISKTLLEKEAINQNISIQELIQKDINNKCKKVTIDNFEDYVSKSNLSNFDTSSIFNYLKIIYQKDRQAQYIDSIKQYISIKIKLQPPIYNIVNTNEILSHDLTKGKLNTEVFIITDFRCPACQQAEKELNKLYKKYNNTVNFKFVFFSDYVDKSALAGEAAAKQNKFKQMHDIIFDNPELLHHDYVYHDFAEEIGLNMAEYEEDANSPKLLKDLINNKELLISKRIYSTPTFIVNGKVLDNRYAIDYLEDVIIEELKLKN